MYETVSCFNLPLCLKNIPKLALLSIIMHVGGERENQVCFLPPVNEALTFNIYVRGETERLSKMFVWLDLLRQGELSCAQHLQLVFDCSHQWGLWAMCSCRKQGVLCRLGLLTAHLRPEAAPIGNFAINSIAWK